MNLIPVAGGTPVVLGQDVYIGNYAFSLDSSEIIYIDNALGPVTGTLEFAKVASAASPVQVATGVYYGCLLSNDGAHLAYLTQLDTQNDTGTLNLFEVSTGATVALNQWVNQFTFAGNDVLSTRQGTPAPFGFLDGLYITPLPSP